MQAIDVRNRWGWLLLGAITLSTIGDEISLITLMFRTADNRTPFADAARRAIVAGVDCDTIHRSACGCT
jgi:hypothetical protein